MSLSAYDAHQRHVLKSCCLALPFAGLKDDEPRSHEADEAESSKPTSAEADETELSKTSSDEADEVESSEPTSAEADETELSETLSDEGNEVEFSAHYSAAAVEAESSEPHFAEAVEAESSATSSDDAFCSEVGMSFGGQVQYEAELLASLLPSHTHRPNRPSHTDASLVSSKRLSIELQLQFVQ